MKNVSRYNCQVVLYATRCLDFFEVYFNVLLSKLRIKSVSKLVYSYFRTNRTISGPAGQSSRNIRKSKGHAGSLKSGFSWPLGRTLVEGQTSTQGCHMYSQIPFDLQPAHYWSRKLLMKLRVFQSSHKIVSNVENCNMFFVVSRSYQDVKAKIGPKHLVYRCPFKWRSQMQ